MTVNDPNIKKLIKEHTPVDIAGKKYIIEYNPSGSCNRCYFSNKICPSKAVTICTSNGGNILKEYKENGR